MTKPATDHWQHYIVRDGRKEEKAGQGGASTRAGRAVVWTSNSHLYKLRNTRSEYRLDQASRSVHVERYTAAN